MKRAILMAALVSLVAVPAMAESPWETDMTKAKEKAKEKNLPILVNFSGSDWCGWCIKLDREVFSQDSFKTFAADNVVLMLADFPRRTKLDEKTTKQNTELAEAHGVQGFPTVLLIDKDGKEIARTGYKPGGADKYVEHLKSLIKGKK